MAKGSPVVLVRLPPDLKAAVVADLARRNYHAREADWTVSDWIRAACREKLAKGQRSRRGKKVAHNEAATGEAT